jgi:D-alanyl-D-alanine carboxypeptidase
VGRLLHGKLSNHKREVASLTKMMTFLVSWEVFQKYFPEEHTVKITVPASCCGVPGTSAFLKPDETFTMHQLFYAMLLPSGNDAALVLADFFGKVLMENNPGQALAKSLQFQDNQPVRHFLREMNVVSQRLGMTNSIFDTPHGLANP